MENLPVMFEFNWRQKQLLDEALYKKNAPLSEDNQLEEEHHPFTVVVLDIAVETSTIFALSNLFLFP